MRDVNNVPIINNFTPSDVVFQLKNKGVITNTKPPYQKPLLTTDSFFFLVGFRTIFAILLF